MSLERFVFIFAIALSLAACEDSDRPPAGSDAFVPTTDDGGVVGDGDLGAPSPPDLSTPPGTPDTHLDVSMQHNDLNRTGWYPYEAALSTSSVSIHRFGKLATHTVDGNMYTQPLYAGALSIPDGTSHNVVYVATEHDSVYAFDADDTTHDVPLWQRTLGTPIADSDLPGACVDIAPEMGITGTPAIDRAAGVMYLVASTKSADGTFHHQLHALDLGDGHERLGGPREITGVVAGTGADSVGGMVTFNPIRQLQRLALTLVNGVLYVGFGGHCILPPYHGWLFAYDAATLQQLGAFADTPNGNMGGAWMGGSGPVATADGDIYFMTGNGTFGNGDLGDSFIHLRSSPTGMQMMDSFTPYNQSYLYQNDLDLGSGGPLAIPGSNLLVGGGKQGIIYVVDRTHMGGYQAASDSQIVQSFQAANGYIFGSPVYWKSPTQELVYLWSSGDSLRAYPLNSGQLDITPASVGSYTSIAGQAPTGKLSVSSHGSDAGSGIIWTSRQWDFENTRQGIFHAFDASDVSKELWNSNQYPLRDGIATATKFATPTIAGGKVFLSTFPNQLVVYGLRPAPVVPSPWLDADVGTVSIPGDASFDATSGTYTVRASGTDFIGTSDSYNFVYQPVTGDVQVTAQVTHIDATNPWAKSAVVIRDSLSPTAPRAATVLMNTVAQFQRRLTDGVTTTENEVAAQPPTWIRITRHGNVFYSYYSSNGSVWTPLGSDTVSMSATAQVGFGFSSVHAAISGAATFQHVSVSAPTDLVDGCPPYPTPVAKPGDDIGGDSWDSYANGFFMSWCTSCHSSTATNRHGAPAGLDWDDPAIVRSHLAGIRGAVGVANSMPPGDPQPACAERLRLLRWVDAGAP